MASILLVEDDRAVRDLLSGALEDAGHEVVAVAGKIDCDGALTRHNWDLVIADVRLPDGSGDEIAEAAERLGLKAILMSGHPEEFIGRANGHALHLQKPFKMAQLLHLIREQVGDS